MQDNILGSEKISTLFAKFSIPAIIAMMIAGMQTMVDGMFIGNVLGPNAMASINIASPFIQLVIALAMIVSIGTQTYMAISVGEKNIEKAQNIFRTFVIFILVVGSVITIFGFTCNEMIASMLGANEVLMNDASVYIKIISLYTIPLSLVFLFGMTTRILEKPELYFNGMVVSLFVNIALNYLLIYKLELGMFGAATATGLAYTSAVVVVIWPLLNKKSIINLFEGRFDKSVIIPVVYNGSSEGINAISAAVTVFLFNAALMKLSGEMGVAAFTAISYVAQIGTLLMAGIADGISPIVSYNYGSKKQDRVNEIMSLASKMTMAIGIILFVVLFIFGKNLVMIFIGNNTEVLGLATIGAKIYAFAFLVNGFNIVRSGYFTAIGDAKSSVIVASSRGLIFVVIGIFILPMIFGINGIWMCVPFADFITLFIGGYLMKKSNKSVKANYGVSL